MCVNVCEPRLGLSLVEPESVPDPEPESEPGPESESDPGPESESGSEPVRT